NEHHKGQKAAVCRRHTSERARRKKAVKVHPGELLRDLEKWSYSRRPKLRRGHKPETRRDAAVHMHMDRDNDGCRHNAVPAALHAELCACRSHGRSVWPAHRFSFCNRQDKAGQGRQRVEEGEQDSKDKVAFRTSIISLILNI